MRAVKKQTLPLTWRSAALVARLPRLMQETLRPLIGSLSRPRRWHLEWIVAAILWGATPKLRHLANHPGPARHRASLSRFLSHSEWDEGSLLAAHGQRTLRRLRPRKGETIDLVLDDTHWIKRARRMAEVGKLWDHCHQRFAHGHIMLTAVVVVRGRILPWGWACTRCHTAMESIVTCFGFAWPICCRPTMWRRPLAPKRNRLAEGFPYRGSEHA